MNKNIKLKNFGVSFTSNMRWQSFYKILRKLKYYNPNLKKIPKNNKKPRHTVFDCNSIWNQLLLKLDYTNYIIIKKILKIVLKDRYFVNYRVRERYFDAFRIKKTQLQSGLLQCKFK